MDNPVISVIVPIYNTEQYLRKCLDSITNQTYKNLQIILVDDGSPDNCGAICDQYAKKDGRIVVIHKENGGVSSARNEGLDVANGEWIGFVDSDDWIELDMYEYLLRLALKYDARMAQCGVVFEDIKNPEISFIIEAERFIPYSAKSYTDEDWLLVNNSTCNKLYNANTIKDIRYNPSYTIGEDLLFNFQALLLTEGSVWGTQAKYHYVQCQDSACHILPNLSTLQSYRLMLKEAEGMFRTSKSGLRFVHAEMLRNNLDVCSKIVRFYRPDFESLKREIRDELRVNFWKIVMNKLHSTKEKLKLMLIVTNWSLYAALLKISKRMDI